MLSYNSNSYKYHGKPLPLMLDRNPGFTWSVIMFAKQNLNKLMAEMICSYLHMIALPELLQQRQEELTFLKQCISSGQTNLPS
jgi:hypothetical protein